MVGVYGGEAPCERSKQTPILSAHLYYPHTINTVLTEIEVLKGRAQVFEFGFRDFYHL